MNLIRQIKTVLWSFVGLGRPQDMGEIHRRGNPLVPILIAFVLVLSLSAPFPSSRTLWPASGKP